MLKGCEHYLLHDLWLIVAAFATNSDFVVEPVSQLAYFQHIAGFTVTPNGKLIVCSKGHCIWTCDPESTCESELLAGTGEAGGQDGTEASFRFHKTSAAAIDTKSRRLLVTDQNGGGRRSRIRFLPLPKSLTDSSPTQIAN